MYICIYTCIYATRLRRSATLVGAAVPKLCPCRPRTQLYYVQVYCTSTTYNKRMHIQLLANMQYAHANYLYIARSRCILNTIILYD